MLNFKVILLALLLLATNILAVRVTYSGTYTGQKVGERTQLLDTVDDDKGEQILGNMATWSDNKYKASKSRSVPNMIIVTNNVKAASKAEASEMVQEMRATVNHNYKPKSRSPSPAPAPGSRSRSPSPARLPRSVRKLKSRSPKLARLY